MTWICQSLKNYIMASPCGEMSEKVKTKKKKSKIFAARAGDMLFSTFCRGLVKTHLSTLSIYVLCGCLPIFNHFSCPALEF